MCYCAAGLHGAESVYKLFIFDYLRIKLECNDV